nr:MAG TPA: hypothetical protein [Caudoviricetes sp.]
MFEQSQSGKQTAGQRAGQQNGDSAQQHKQSRA